MAELWSLPYDPDETTQRAHSGFMRAKRGASSSASADGMPESRSIVTACHYDRQQMQETLARRSPDGLNRACAFCYVVDRLFSIAGIANRPAPKLLGHAMLASDVRVLAEHRHVSDEHNATVTTRRIEKRRPQSAP